MASERRLHPASIVFGLLSQIRELAVPLIAVVVAGSSRGGNWEVLSVFLLVPYAGLAIVRYLNYRYAFAETELVIRSGILTRNERHIPYARIQNLDASQNVLHRVLGVVVARVDTGGGEGADATLNAITREAYEEIREHVFAGRTQADAEADAGEAAPRGEMLLTLPTRELVTLGLIENRGMIVVAAAMGLLYQSGVQERLLERVTGDSGASERFIRGIVERASDGSVGHSVLIGVVVFLVAILLIRLLSVGLAIVRLHGFTLRRFGEDLRAEFGLLTRVTATVPLRRVQTVTVSAGLLHRLFGRASVRVDTAGGDGPQVRQQSRESLAPIIAADRWPALVREVLPELSLDDIEWRPPAPGAFGRELRQHLVVAGIFSSLFLYNFGWWALAVFAALVPWCWLSARGQIRHMGWATRDGIVLHRSGWLRRHLSMARYTRIQTVAMYESPFDRRWRMAQIRVDTAGANGSPHRIHVPYLTRDDAATLHAELAAAAGRTTFRW